MKIGIVLACTVILAGPSFADEDPNLTQMKKLYTKISQVLSVSNNPVRQGGTFLVLTSPGYLLDPTLDPDGNTQDRVLLNALVEKTMEPDWIYRPKTLLTSELYRNILTYKQAPDFTLSADAKKQLDAINSDIYKTDAQGISTYTAAWSQFVDLQGAYATAVDDYQTWMNLHPGQAVPAVISNNLKQAKNKYLTIGDGTRRATELQRKREIEAFDPETWWAELQSFFDNNVDDIGGKPYPRDLYYPKYANWIDKKASWSTVTITQKDFQQTTSNSATSMGGGLGFSYGLFSIGGSGSGSSDSKKLNQDVSELSVAFDVLRVNIERPWMDTMVFYSQAWQWGCGAGVINNPVISNGGDPSKGQQLSGLMPFLPTGILVAKNLRISAKISSEVQTATNSQSGGGGSVSFGPFRLGGSASSSSHSTFVHATATGTGVSFDDPQIIGFFVEVIPQSPNPLPNLVFKKCSPALGATPLEAKGVLDKGSIQLLDKYLNKIKGSSPKQ